MTLIVDSDTARIRKTAAVQLSIPPQLVPIDMNTDGTAVQCVLKQAAMLRAIRRMRPISTHFSPSSDLAGDAHHKFTWLLSEWGGGPHLIITDCSQRDEDHPHSSTQPAAFLANSSAVQSTAHARHPHHRIVPMLVAMDVLTAQTSIVKPPAPGFLQLNAPIMLNAQHVLDTPNGGHLFVGMAEAWRKRCMQQMLLYKLGDLSNGGLVPGGALHLAWQAHVTWTSCLDKGEPVPLPALEPCWRCRCVAVKPHQCHRPQARHCMDLWRWSISSSRSCPKSSPPETACLCSGCLRIL